MSESDHARTIRLGGYVGPEIRWFAWYPVRTENHGWRWLRYVHCREIFKPWMPIGCTPHWEYMP